MAALKLFISHSSRLRPASADGAEAQANWQLLQDTCTGLKTEYGDKIEILVDYEGLHPGDDWERRLNEWLAECHAAIILFSRRAIEESNWVRKEAAILSWRAELDPGFPLFPVLLDQQSSAEDLENDFFGTLRINRTQCVTKVTTAAQILDGIKPKLGDHPAILRGTGTTPFQLLLETVESAITDQISLPNLQRLSERLFPETARPSTHAACASVLARHLLNKGKTYAAAISGLSGRGAATSTPRACRRALEVPARTMGRRWSVWEDFRRTLARQVLGTQRRARRTLGTRTGHQVLYSRSLSRTRLARN
jgi:hypothetical protein